MKYIIGNWKSNKNSAEVDEWFKIFAKLYSENKNIKLENLEIVVCPPFVYLPKARQLKEEFKLPIKIGAQDVSPFDNGAYTGAISAKMVAQYAEYVIIGHSERRANFKEEDKVLSGKVKRGKETNIKTIFCVPDENALIPDGVSLVAYEPVWAIGTGVSDTPENANEIAKKIKTRWQGEGVIYGGSVTPENIKSFVGKDNIDGVLPGGASLDPQKFWQIIVNVSTI